ncbi:MAG: PEGA domain-containing protein, partial [bacterium]
MGFLIRIGLLLVLGFNLGFCEELMVASYPIIDAFLYIDGKHSGQTPAKITIKPGKYKLKAEKEGWIGEEKEVIVKEGEGCIFVNIFMRREEGKKTEERIQSILLAPEQPTSTRGQRIEDRRQKTENREQKIEPQLEEELPKIAEIPKEESEGQRVKGSEGQSTKISEIPQKPKEEPQIRAKEEKIRRTEEIIQKPKENIQAIILKASFLIEEAEKEGAERYAKERIKRAKNLLKKAEKENSSPLALSAINEAELALKETKEKISHYSSSYVMGIFLFC